MLLLVKDPIKYSHSELISIFSNASHCFPFSMASYADLMSMFLELSFRKLTKILNNADTRLLLVSVPSV